MLNFTFSMPTKILFGRGAEKKVGLEIRDRGCRRVLIHYGSGSAVKSGLVDQVAGDLEREGLSCILLGGVVPNPRLSLVRKGAELCRRERIDFILAIGGGSVIDSAKAIGYGAANDCDVWDIYDKKAVPEQSIPLGVVLTIAAAGSETSDSSVITNEDGWLKRGFHSDLCRPVFAAMNPELTCTLPPYQTASGGVDIMMHALERYFTPTEGVDLTDRLCEGLLLSVMKNLSLALKEPDNYDARAELMWAGSLAHNGLLSTGREGDWACHQIQHELGGMFDVAHGAGLAAVWGSWARAVCSEDPERFAQLALRVMGCEATSFAEGARMSPSHMEELALQGIEAMEDFFRSVGMPVSLSELGIHPDDDQLRELAHKCVHFGARTVGGLKKLDEEAVLEIYKMARAATK